MVPGLPLLLFGCVDVFRPRADSDDIAGNPVQDRQRCEHAEHERRLHLRLDVEQRGQEAVLDCDLDRLDHPHWKHAPALDRPQVSRHRRAARESRIEHVRRGDRILNGEIDADAADRRHRVSRVADAQESRTIPFAQAVDFNG